MKSKLLLVVAFLFTLFTFAQVPQGISYQAIALNASGNPVVSSNVGLRLSVLDNTATGTVLYTETHLKMTNAKGLFNLVIGQGTPTTGTFAGINWKVNSKFLKVEMDVAGGTNYVLTGTTQLIAVPYALAADGLVMSAGEALTLVSPNGTSYQLSVNDSGQLSLPTSNSASNIPTNFFLYGTFNSYDPFGALLMNTDFNFGINKYGYKYFTSGTELKILSANNASGVVYGLNGSGEMIQNGSPLIIPSNGFYLVSTSQIPPSTNVYFGALSINLSLLNINNAGSNTTTNATYNVATNTFSFVVNNVITTNNTFLFIIPTAGNSTQQFGDNLADTSIELGGPAIVIPNTTFTPKNFRVDLVLNFNGSGNYTITQLP